MQRINLIWLCRQNSCIPVMAAHQASGVAVQRLDASTPDVRYETQDSMGDWRKRCGPDEQCVVEEDSFHIPSGVTSSSKRTLPHHERLLQALMGGELGFGTAVKYVWKSSDVWAATFTFPVHYPSTGQVGIDLSSATKRCVIAVAARACVLLAVLHSAAEQFRQCTLPSAAMTVHSHDVRSGLQ